MEFKTNDLLKSYIQKIDQKANDLLQYYLFQVVMFSPTLMGTDFPNNQDTIRTGCRVWVRYLNNVDLNQPTNILFVNRDLVTPNGRDGKKFVELLDNDGDILGKVKELQGGSIDVMPYLTNLISGGALLLGFASLFESSKAEREKAVTKEALRLMQELFIVFNDFIEKYQIEYSNQFGFNPDLPFYKQILDDINPVNKPKTKNPINPLSPETETNVTPYVLGGILLLTALKKKRRN